MSDQREELAEIVRRARYVTEPTTHDWRIADAVLAAGWVKLADLASDPDVIEKVARYNYWRSGFRQWGASEDAEMPLWRHHARMLLEAIAALAATPENREAK